MPPLFPRLDLHLLPHSSIPPGPHRRHPCPGRPLLPFPSTFPYPHLLLPPHSSLPDHLPTTLADHPCPLEPPLATSSAAGQQPPLASTSSPSLVPAPSPFSSFPFPCSLPSAFPALTAGSSVTGPPCWPDLLILPQPPCSASPHALASMLLSPCHAVAAAVAAALASASRQPPSRPPSLLPSPTPFSSFPFPCSPPSAFPALTAGSNVATPPRRPDLLFLPQPPCSASPHALTLHAPLPLTCSSCSCRRRRRLRLPVSHPPWVIRYPLPSCHFIS